MSGNRINNPESISGDDSNIWTETMRDEPSFYDLERQKDIEADQGPIPETDIAAHMLDVSSEQQGELVDYLNQINSGAELHGDAFSAYEDYLDKNQLSDTSEAMAAWQKELSGQLERYERMDRCIMSGLEDLDRSENAGKTLAEVFEVRAMQIQQQLTPAIDADKSKEITDEQRDALIGQYNEYQNLANWAPDVRRSLEYNSRIESDAGKIGENMPNNIDIDTMIEDLQAEIKKRQGALGVLKARDQRDYGDTVLDATIKLNQKQADLHVIRMIQLANSDQSEDETVSPENATATIEKYISDREKYIDNLTQARAQYVKGSAEYQDLTKKRSKWYREIDAARRVARQLGLDVNEHDAEEA